MEILKELLKNIPNGDRIISDALFEGANIVLYTTDKEFFLDNQEVVRALVSEFKKRIEIRADPKTTMDEEKAEEIIKKVLPESADLIIFDPQRSQVIIETENPGSAIGKQGSVLKEIKEKTMWTPLIKRTPAIRSKLIENIRAVLYQNSDYRRKFLHKVGLNVYSDWQKGKQDCWVRVSVLGAGRQVGRSCFLLQTPQSRILLDCGINPANPDEYPYFEAPEFNIQDIDAVIVSHAHMDHAGLIPYLFKMQYKGPIYCTLPTRDVMSLLLIDQHKIAMGEGKNPLFDIEDIKEMVKHTICLDYGEVTDITPDIRITFHNAGHIIGSSMVHMHIGNGAHNLLYTADIKYGKTMLLDPAITKFPRLESMLIEATLGGKGSPEKTVGEAQEQLAVAISETINGKGQVLVPVLGVGRAQEVMLVVEQLIREGKIPEVPVFVDGMVWDVTAIHTAYPEFLSKTVRQGIFQRDHNPFLSPIFKQVGSQKERVQILEETGPCVILATSGMLVGGPSVYYLQKMMDNPKNCLCFVCYQAEGGLGRRILNGEKEFFYGNQSKEVNQLKMRVEDVQGLSGHSNKKELMSFVKKLDPKPRKVMTNHGDVSRCIEFASLLHKTFKMETMAPKNLDVIRLR